MNKHLNVSVVLLLVGLASLGPLIVFSLAGAIAGLAGGLYTFHEGFVWPDMLGVTLSTQIVLYALLGGAGTLIGAVIGVLAIEIASFWLADSYPLIWPIICEGWSGAAVVGLSFAPDLAISIM